MLAFLYISEEFEAHTLVWGRKGDLTEQIISKRSW